MVHNFQKQNPRVKPRREKAFLSFGSGAELMSEDWLLDQLEPVGMTRRSVRSFIRSLNLPLIWIGNTAFVNFARFQRAIATISRQGQPDFLAPGCEPIRRARYPEVESVKALDPSVEESLREEVTQELKESRPSGIRGDHIKRIVDLTLDPVMATQMTIEENKRGTA